MTTDVSMRPFAWRISGTRFDVLLGVTVQILTETSGINRRAVRKSSKYRGPANETAPAKRDELADRDAVTGDHEGLALIEPAHDLAAVVAEFSLGDRFNHAGGVARVRHQAPNYAATYRTRCLSRASADAQRLK